jgi:hypothetical protein
MPDEFNVVLFFPDSTSFYEQRNLDAEQAVLLAKQCSERPAAKLGIIERVIVTDAEDYTVFEWQFGQGVTFPKPEP